MPSFNEIITADFDFAALKELFFKIYTNPTIEEFISHIRNFIEGLPPFVWAVILGGLGLVLSNFGKKILAIPSIILSAAFGFVMGYFALSPLLVSLVEKLEFLQSFVTIDPVVVGIICAAIGALLFLPLYFVGYVAGFAYSAYILSYPLFEKLIGEGAAPFAALGVLVGVVILTLMFRKWVEMCGTAVVGAYFVMLAVNQVVLLYAVVNYIIWGVLAVQGAVVQIKTRRRY